MIKSRRNSDGRLLFEAYAKKCEEKKVSIKAGAAEIGMSDGYIRALSSGERRVDGLQMDVFRKFAEFLDVPVVQVLLMAGVVSADDFIYEKSIDEEFDYFIEAIKKDDEIGPLFRKSDQLKDLDEDLKIALILLFERAFKTRLLDKIKRVEGEDQLA